MRALPPPPPPRASRLPPPSAANDAMPLASSAAPPTTSSLLAPTPPSTRRRVVVVRRPRPRSSPRTTTTTTRAHWNVARTGTRAHSRAPHQISIALPRPISDHLGFAPEHLPAPHRYPELEARRRGFAPLFLGRLERFFFFGPFFRVGPRSLTRLALPRSTTLLTGGVPTHGRRDRRGRRARRAASTGRRRRAHRARGRPAVDRRPDADAAEEVRRVLYTGPHTTASAW